MTKPSFRPAPGHVVIERTPPPDFAVTPFDFQDEHLVRPTWGRVIAVGKKVPLTPFCGPINREHIAPLSPLALFAMRVKSVFQDLYFGDVDVKVGDLVSFSHMYNVQDQAANQVIIVSAADLRCKIGADSTVFGVCGNVALKIDLGDYYYGGVKVRRSKQDQWVRGEVVSGRHAGKIVTFSPSMAIPVQYHWFGEKQADGIYVVHKDQILWYAEPE